jgi:hypothetical protein
MNMDSIMLVQREDGPSSIVATGLDLIREGFRVDFKKGVDQSIIHLIATKIIPASPSLIFIDLNLTPNYMEYVGIHFS